MFENLETANAEYEKLKSDFDKITKEKDELNLQFENQKTILEENKSVIDGLNNEVNRLKIKNYEYYEQISCNQSSTDNSDKKSESSITINDILKMF